MEELLKYFHPLTEEMIAKFKAMKDMYESWNSRINVISRKDMNDFYLHHVLHSLSVAKVLGGMFKSGDTVLDVGTGGGFPGIPLAIMYPEMHFTLCDSIGKKVKVAESIANGLRLNNVECVNARVESLNRNFDWIVSRAVTSLDCFLPWIADRYEKGVAYLKGGDINDEISKAACRHLLNPNKLTIIDISDYFNEEWFKEKKILFLGR